MRPEVSVLEWMVFIEHNYPDAAPGRGSAVFIHLWNGPDDHSSACVALSQDRLTRLMRWLDPATGAEIVLLPAKKYSRFWKAWGLPEPAAIGLGYR